MLNQEIIMKGRLVITAILFTLFTSCHKKNVQNNADAVSNTDVSKAASASNKVYASPWEEVPAWSEKQSAQGKILSFTRRVPQLQDVAGNAVLVFVRNVWDKDILPSKEIHSDIPMSMPFYFLSYNEKPGYTEEWKYTALENKINIQLTVRGSEDKKLPARNIQLRYIVIPQSLLRQKDHTIEEIQQMSYDEIQQLFDFTS